MGIVISSPDVPMFHCSAGSEVVFQSRQLMATPRVPIVGVPATCGEDG